MNYLLGIDIGGTKYHLRAQKDRGSAVDLVVESKGNLRYLGVSEMVKEIDRQVKALQSKLKTRQAPAGVCIGMAGLDSSELTRKVMRELSKKTWWKCADPNRRSLVNDIKIGMLAGTDREYGISVISGTGSNGYGIDEHGNEAWVGGRGIRMAGEGSGVQIGLDCLHAVRRAEDGRGDATQLMKRVFDEYGVRSTEGLMSVIYEPEYGMRELAQLNHIVELAAADGDKVARRILEEAAGELVLMVKTLYRRLKFGRGMVDVVMIGGTINHNKELQRLFLRGMRKLKWANTIPIVDAPVAGAIRMLEN